MSRSGDFLLTMTMTTTEPITLSLVHARRVKMVSLPYEGTSLSISCSPVAILDLSTEVA